MRRIVVRAAACAVAVACTSPLVAADAVDRITRVVPLAPGTALAVDATIGVVTITGSRRADARIEIVRRAPDAGAFARFPATVETTADGVHVTVAQADDRRDADLKADITIEMPAEDVVGRVRVFEGRVRLSGLRTACDVDLRRGSIEAVGLAGRIRLEGGIGTLDVRDSDLTAGGMMRLRLFNGPLHVRFPRTPANGRILALVFNGALRSDIPLATKDQFGPRFGETTLGAGDPVLSMDVVKGEIAITVDRPPRRLP